MNTRVLLLGCLLALAVQAQESKRELWTWKDANGVTQFSDRPVPGAKKVELTGVTPSPSAAPAPAVVAPPARASVKSVVQYQSLEIWQPAQDETFYGADTAISVRLRSDPDLAPGDRLVLALDGRRVDGSPDSYEHLLTNLPRGAHSLSAAIVDEQGNAKIRSEPRVFHVQQPTVNEPRAVGPNLKPSAQPKPKPTPKPAPTTGK
jgi:hypothetical protein